MTAAAVSGTVDATVALAAINFDFSIVKIEARKEYKDLGHSLSPFRSHEAEEGETHVTARKLGALFAGVIPSTTHLFQAYGLRASEIASSRYNPRGSRADGIFADHVGADATTIWAAATSGDDAIAVHLLACMLARMWPGPEATSIWFELVEERKKELTKQDHRDSVGIAQLTTSRINLTRNQLSKWDASARAWLLTADEAKALPQTQLMLILNNLRAPMNSKTSVYASVLDAWKTSMLTMDKILFGTHQSISNAAPLLGLASWHLYPDMVILGNATKKVVQNDRLMVSGGLLTIGFHSTKTVPKGVSWALPLAHLKFYGDPIMVKGVLSHDTSRVSMDQLLCVALGALLGPWLDSKSMLNKLAGLLVHMKDLLRKDSDERTCKSTWLYILGEAAEGYLNASWSSQTEQRQLISAGIRRYSDFLGTSTALPPPVFGLLNIKNLLSIHDGPEPRIRFLRHMAKLKYPEAAARMIIQYQFSFQLGPSQYEYATVEPVKNWCRGNKRDRLGVCLDTLGSHVRWMETTASDDQVSRRRAKIESFGEKVILVRSTTFLHSLSAQGTMRWADAPNDVFKAFAGRACSGLSQNTAIDFKMVLGDPELGAIYVTQEDGWELEQKSQFLREDVIEAFTQGTVDRMLFLGHLQAFMHRDVSTKIQRNIFELHKHSKSVPSVQNELMMSLQGLATAVHLYKSLPGARVSLKVANRPLCKWQWLMFSQGHLDSSPKRNSHWILRGLMPVLVNQAQIFAAIAAFESGSFEVVPRSVKSVMALSCGNSIYVADCLLHDPWLVSKEMSVTRVVGNLGRPGMVMMIPPGTPKTLRINESSWQSINHDDFDGISDDSFQQSTLHLSFSGWELEIDTGNVGGQDSEVSFAEAPVALHDRGVWVADLDILRMFRSSKFHRVGTLPCHCTQKTSGKRSVPWDLTSIDKWEELLESPTGAGIVRAHANWQARLAATALSVKLGHQTYLLPPDVCWDCYIRRSDFAKPKLYQLFDEDMAESSDGSSLSMDNSEEYEASLESHFQDADPVAWDSDEDSEGDEWGDLQNRDRYFDAASELHADEDRPSITTHRVRSEMYIC